LEIFLLISQIDIYSLIYDMFLKKLSKTNRKITKKICIKN